MRYLRNLLISSSRRLRKMATSSTSSSPGAGRDHLERTAQSSRLEVVSPATVVSLRLESQTVKGLTLKVEDPKLSFKAGQWVDAFLPGVDRVTGYSMCSSPGKLKTEGLLDLAVKYSEHPSASWIHKNCLIGDQLFLRPGGDFFFDPSVDLSSEDVLLIAGGIGINPLYSIFRHIQDLRQQLAEAGKEGAEKGAAYVPGKALLLYSAVNKGELIFRSEIDKICKDSEDMHVKYFVTKVPSKEKALTYGRIGYQEVCTALQSLNPDTCVAYICGPASMIESMESYLLQSGLDKSRIKYEKWW